MRHINVSKARAELPNLVDSSERTVITRNGRPVAVLLSVADFRALRAAADLAREPERAAEILRLHRQVQRGDFSDFRRLDLQEDELASSKQARALREPSEGVTPPASFDVSMYPPLEVSSSTLELRDAGGYSFEARLQLLEQSILSQVQGLLADLRKELTQSVGAAAEEAGTPGKTAVRAARPAKSVRRAPSR
jgi:prevent-host-death family protein